jgi:hypothetical protein
MRTYLREVSLTAEGTKAAASLSELATKMTVNMAPNVIWNRSSVYVRPIRELGVRVVLSPMTFQAVLGSPSLRTLTITPM